MANPWAYAYNAVKYIANTTSAANNYIAKSAPLAAAAAPTVSSGVPSGASATQSAQDLIAQQQAQINDAQDQNMRKAALAAQGGMMSNIRNGGRGYGIDKSMTSSISLGGGNQGLGA